MSKVGKFLIFILAIICFIIICMILWQVFFVPSSALYIGVINARNTLSS